MKIAAIVGNNIRRYRKAAGLSLMACEERSGVTRSQINTIEHGRSNAALLTLSYIAEACGVTVAKLFIEPRGRKCK